MSRLLSRGVPLMLMSVLLVGALPGPVAAAAPSRAETYMLGLLNRARTNRGLPALQWNSRLNNVAQDRSDKMARNRQLDHRC